MARIVFEVLLLSQEKKAHMTQWEITDAVNIMNPKHFVNRFLFGYCFLKINCNGYIIT